MATPDATSRWRAAVSNETREPPEPPAMTAGVMSSCRSSWASASACMADSELPVKQTSDSPQFGRSQIRTRLPSSANAAASSRTPGESLLNRPPGVMPHDRGPSPMTSKAIETPSTVARGMPHTTLTSMSKNGFVVDADSHWCEPPDLFTSLAPAEYKDRVPHVETVDGERMWVFDGEVMGRFGAGGVIDRDGVKEEANIALFEWEHEMIHAGAYDPKVRLEVLDECGIDAQVIFPSTIGLGGQNVGLATDDALRHLAIELYNDRMAQIQAESNNRLLPMPLMPAWSVASCVREAERVADLGARGVNMTSDP